MDLRYSESDEAFRAALRDWLERTLPQMPSHPAWDDWAGRRRFDTEGPAGLVERSRCPHSSPQRISAETEDAIIRLRKELRVDCGAQAIAYI